MEFREKLGRVIAESLGDNADNMYYLETLATSPASQGQGFGSALVKSVIKEVRHSKRCSNVPR